MGDHVTTCTQQQTASPTTNRQRLHGTNYSGRGYSRGRLADLGERWLSAYLGSANNGQTRASHGSRQDGGVLQAEQRSWLDTDV